LSCLVLALPLNAPSPAVTHNLMLLPEGRVDLEMRRPELLLGFVGGEIFKAGDRQRLARSAVPGSGEPSF